jgi:hypothetical protein
MLHDVISMYPSVNTSETHNGPIQRPEKELIKRKVRSRKIRIKSRLEKIEKQIVIRKKMQKQKHDHENHNESAPNHTEESNQMIERSFQCCNPVN